MWTLIIFTFWSMSQSSDAGSTLSITGFSSKASCEKAGKQIIEDSGNVVKFKRAGVHGMPPYNTTQVKSLYYHYQCVEVKQETRI